MAAWVPSTTLNFNNTTTISVGDTSGLTLTVVDTGTNVELQATITAGTWNAVFIRNEL